MARQSVIRKRTCRDCGDLISRAAPLRPTQCIGCYMTRAVRTAAVHKATAQPKDEAHKDRKRKPRPPYFTLWIAIRERTSKPSCKSYPRYGGRGITLYVPWRTSFAAFRDYVASLPGAGQGLTLDRINNDGNYEPGNLRWATRKQQNSNRCSTRLITWNGQTKPLYHWAAEMGMDGCALSFRLRHWPVERAMTEPPKKDRRRA